MGLEAMVIRLLLIILLSFLIGLEREYNNQPAGLRTHILIGIGSTLLMILSIKIAGMPGNINGDPGRIAAQVVSGIGFIGAGAIMKMGLNTKGLTTAANIWVTSAIGLTVGAGLFDISIIATVLILFNLVIITKLKSKLIKQTRYCYIDITFKKEKVSEKSILNLLYSLPIKIMTKEIKENASEIYIKITTKIDRKTDIYSIKKEFKNIKNIIALSISENSQ